MSRSLRVTWRNGRGGRWTRRARWYAASGDGWGDDNFRLCFEDEDGLFNHFPSSLLVAHDLWSLFKCGEINAKGMTLTA